MRPGDSGAPPSHQHATGSVDAEGRYVLREALGRGGMGVVFRAHDARLDRSVAVKLLPASAVADTTLRARMLREARLAAALEHPGVVRVYDVGPSLDGGLFVVMELVHGRTLRAAAVGASHGQVLLWGASIARTLGVAHAAGIVHRDIKPDNVMIRDDGSTAILDFGIAKAVQAPVDAYGSTGGAVADWLTGGGQIVGTLAYMSPEQMRGGAVDGRSDQWSLAVALFELLTGHLPWDAASPTALIAAVLDTPARAPSSLCPALPPGLDGVLLRALSRDVRSRFEGDEAFADALESLAGSRPSSPTDHAVIAPAHAAPAGANPGSLLSPLQGPDPFARTELLSDAGGPAMDASTSQHTLAGPPLAPAPRARRLLLGVAFASLAALAGVALLWRGRPSPLPAPQHPAGALSSSPGPAAPLLHPSARLACPPLDAPEPAHAWLGAAVASAVCRRAGLALGDPLTRVLAPADLLDLPRAPTSASVPYDASSRGRALTRTREGGMVWLDGQVSRREGVIHANFILRDTGAEPLLSWASSGSIIDVERHAIRVLRERGQLPENLPMHKEFARWHLLPDARAALALRDVSWDHAEGKRTDAACATLLDALASGPDLRHRIACSAGWSPVDLSALPAEQLSAVLAVQTPTEREARPLALTLGQTGARTPSPYGRERLAAAESRAWLAAREPARAVDAALRATQAVPFDLEGYMRLYNATYARVDSERLGVHYASWLPEAAGSWERIATSHAYGSRENLDAFERSAVLLPSSVSTVTDMAAALSAAGRHDEARGWAARLLGHDDARHVAGEILSAIATASEGRFDDAARGVLDLLGRLDALGNYQHQDLYLAAFAYYLGELLGRSNEFGSLFHRRFVLAEPPRILGRERGGAWWALDVSLSFCLMADRTAQTACIRKLQALDGSLSQTDQHATLLAGQIAGGPRADEARRLVAGVAETTSVIKMPFLSRLPGEDEVSDRVDEAEMRLAGWFHGATMAHVRQARRAFRRGDRERAQALASTVVRAWSTVDHPPAASEEMRALLRRLAP